MQRQQEYTTAIHSIVVLPFLVPVRVFLTLYYELKKKKQRDKNPHSHLLGLSLKYLTIGLFYL